MQPDDEPHLRIAVRDYVDREVERAVRLVAAQFVTLETARQIAKEVHDRHEAEASAFGRWSMERAMALVAIGIALAAFLSKG